MTDKELIERLRDSTCLKFPSMALEAADLIEQLQRENDELIRERDDYWAVELVKATNQLAAAQAKVAWVEGNTPNWGGWPWDAPYNDGYETAKAEFRKEIVAVEEQLAAAREREAKLREALEFVLSKHKGGLIEATCKQALAQTEVK